MGDATDGEGGGLDPAEAFELLGNETRVGILRALVEAGETAERSFSALRDAVGSTDSGRFNYHLDRLVGHFVERTDEGYSLRYPGRKVGHAVLAGTFNERATMPPTPVEGECHDCESAALVAEYAEENMEIRCGECANVVLQVPFPPGAVSSRDPEGVLSAFDRWASRHAALATDGVCPECAGEMTGSVRTDVPPEMDHEVFAEFTCSVCNRRSATSFGGVAIQNPEVLAFHHRRDVSPRERPYWTNETIVTGEYTTVRSEDPWRIEVTFHVAGDALAVTLDGEASVIEVREA